MTGRQAVLTGVGVVSPLALDARTHFDTLLAGASAVRCADRVHFSEQAGELEARVRGFDRRGRITNRMLRKLLSASAGYAVGAAGEALADAGLIADPRRRERCGVYVGSLALEIDPEMFVPALRASLTRDGRFDIALFARRGTAQLDPLFLVRALPNAGVCGISVEHQVLGPNTNLTNGATSGMSAIALALAAVRRGDVDCAVAGGYDTLLVMDSLAEHLIAGRLSRRVDHPQRACRPFDRERDGYALGEGAAFVVVEEAGHARERGARPYAYLRSCAETTDSAQLHAAEPVDGAALAEAGRAALAAAGLAPAAVGVVAGDGLGTTHDDLREAAALTGLLGGAPVPFTAATAALGFTGVAGGAFSVVHAALAVHHRVVPPLPTCTDPDPRCPVHFATRPRPLAVPHALAWTSDRGVKNVAAVLTADGG